MKFVCLALLLLAVSCMSQAKPQGARSETAPKASATDGGDSERPASNVDLTPERTRIDEADAARKASDYRTARAKVAEAVASLLARSATEQDAAWLALLDSAGFAAWKAEDARTANTAWKRVLDVRLLTLPDDHAELQRTRDNLANTMAELGDLAGARALEEKVLEVRSRTLPDDHPDLQRTRMNLASTIADLGDLRGARALEEKVLEIRTRTLSDDHADLQAVRSNLASTLSALGDHAGARELKEKVLEVLARTLPEGHLEIQRARVNLSGTLYSLGDLEGARALLEQALAVLSKILPDDHPLLLLCQQNLALAIGAIGDLAGARDLEERILEVRSRKLPADHPAIQDARSNLATTVKILGDLGRARALQEQVLEVRSRTLPDDHPALQAARFNLARTLGAADDLVGARALQEKVLEVRSGTLPDDHPELQLAREGLAITMKKLGDLVGARALQEKVLAVRSRTFPEDHPAVQWARGNLAGTLCEFGELEGAAGLYEEMLEAFSRSSMEDLPDLQTTRMSLATTIARQSARAGRSFGEERCAELIGAMCRAQVRAARAAILGNSAREAEERCSSLVRSLDASLSFAGGYGVFESSRALEAEALLLSETTRGAAIASAALTRRAAHAPRYSELRAALGAASQELAQLAQGGTTSDGFDRARSKRESVEGELVDLARELSSGKDSLLNLGIDSLSERLGAREAAVGFRRFQKSRVDVRDEPDLTGQPATARSSVASLCAFVIRSSLPAEEPDSARARVLTLVDLGPIGPIEESVRVWRDGLGVGSASRGVGAGARNKSTADLAGQGTALRERVFDPLLPALAGARRIVFALDDVLHLVPFDALPLDDGSLVGGRWRIETRATLTELLPTSEPLVGSGQLVTFGDVEYGAETTHDGAALGIQLAGTGFEPRADDQAGILRGSPWSEGFSALPGTGVETRGVVDCFRDRFGVDAAPELCEHAGATRQRLLALAPHARWLHIATHGWFAPESITSWSDPEPLDEYTGLGSRTNSREQVKGMSPMLLCGLALAGANLPEDAIGRVPGLVTADELSALDLTNCELVVLSACDTNVGERRAGQGVASLQKALQMAGARSVITSLWMVPDDATKELMIDFYRRLWIEGKPKQEALWESKMQVRNEKDEMGRPKYTTRDWAAWVLTGDPD